jgi:hypothetical protein
VSTVDTFQRTPAVAAGGSIGDRKEHPLKTLTTPTTTLALAPTLAFIVASVVLFSGPALAAVGTVQATVASAISVTQDTGGEMKFGAAAPTGSAATVTLDPQSGTRGGTATLIGSTGFQPGAFTVAGSGALTFAITHDATATLTHTNSTDTMTATLTSFPASTGTLVGGGAPIKVGGSLAVGTTQATGAYTGTYGLTVTYN